jgi:hypothetical protein
MYLKYPMPSRLIQCSSDALTVHNNPVVFDRRWCQWWSVSFDRWYDIECWSEDWPRKTETNDVIHRRRMTIYTPDRIALVQASYPEWNHWRTWCVHDHQWDTWNDRSQQWMFDDTENLQARPRRSHSPTRISSRNIYRNPSNDEDDRYLLLTRSSVVSCTAGSSSGNQQGCSWTRRVIVSNRWRMFDMNRMICASRSLWGGNACSDKVNNWHL